MPHSIGKCCGTGHFHAEWPMLAEVLLDGEHYAEISTIADGEKWIKGRKGSWSVVPRDPCPVPAEV